MHALLLAAKQQNPSSVPLVPHFGQTLMMLDCDPLNNGLGVLLHNTGHRGGKPVRYPGV